MLCLLAILTLLSVLMPLLSAIFLLHHKFYHVILLCVRSDESEKWFFLAMCSQSVFCSSSDDVFMNDEIFFSYLFIFFFLIEKIGNFYVWIFFLWFFDGNMIRSIIKEMKIFLCHVTSCWVITSYIYVFKRN